MVDFLPSRNGKVYLLHLVTGQPTQSTDQSHLTLVTSANGERHLAAGQVLHKIRDLSPIEELSRKEYPSRARITRLTEMGGWLRFSFAIVSSIHYFSKKKMRSDNFS